jgi:cytidylate kinase
MALLFMLKVKKIKPTLSSKLQLSPIVLVCGRICSGKDTYCNQLAEENDCGTVVVSKIVGQLLSDDCASRADLQNTADLTERICEELDRRISDGLEQDKMVIVNGIRQPEIVEYLIALYSMQQVSILWLDPGSAERKKRWELRADPKDLGQTFEEQDAADDQLGLHVIEQWVQQTSDNYQATTNE